MDRTPSESALRLIFTDLAIKLGEAARIAKAAEAAALAGGAKEAVAVSMDIDTLLYEASRLHDAASLINRLTDSS